MLPCLNESETLSTVIQKAQKSILDLGLSGEVIVADNGSTDGSQIIALSAGARLVDVPLRGYGAALQAGIAASRGKYVIMGDADDSYALDDLTLFLLKLNEGFELVMGNRFAGGIEPGAMPWLHKYIGNPVLSWMGRLFFKVSIKDFHCGLRGFNRKSILDLDLTSTGMEFASEMVVKAALNNLRIAEVPTTLKPDGRSRAPHLRTWRDGWRHLIFLLFASPRWLFLVPSLILMSLGLLGMIATGFGMAHIASLYFYTNTYFFSIGSLISGLQLFLMSILARIFSTQHGFIPKNSSISKFDKLFTLERGILVSIFGIFCSFVTFSYLAIQWKGNGFSTITTFASLRITGLLLVLICSSIQILFGSFFAALIQKC